MSSRRALAFSFLDRYASLAVGIFTTMVLARLLSPAEVGIYSVAMALMALASTVRDMGAGTYLLQEQELTEDRNRAVWTVQLGLGLLLAALVAALSAPAAAFYGEPMVRTIMLVLALNYLVNPLGSVTYAWLMRELRYDAIAVMRFSSTLAGALVSIALAWRGWGAASLAWGSLVATAVNAAVSVAYRPAGYPWKPGLREIRRVLSFGSRLTATSVLNTITASTPEFLLGKLQSMAAAGFYSRANGLVALFNRLVTDAAYTVALSLFSKSVRAGEPLAPSFLRAVSYLTVLSWTFSIALAFLAQPVVSILFGAQWEASVELTRWLAGAAALVAPVPLCTAALVGSGKVRPMLKTTVLATLSTVCAAAIGTGLGMSALGPCLLAASAVNLALWLTTTRSCVGFTWRALGATFKASIGVAICAGAAPLLTTVALGVSPANPLIALALGGVGCGGLMLATLAWLKHPLMEEFRRLGQAILTHVRALRARWP